MHQYTCSKPIGVGQHESQGRDGAGDLETNSTALRPRGDADGAVRKKQTPTY